MAQVVSLRNFRPSARHDGVEWTNVRVEEADDPTAGPWTTVDTVPLEDVDLDPERPELRNVTTSASEKAWLRLVFLDSLDGEDEPCPFIYAPGPSFRPTLAGVSTILRARTYTDGSVDDPTGEQTGIFDENTRPTAEQVEDEIIPDACSALLIDIGEVPGEMVDQARRVAAMKAAAEIERSYLPEQTEGDQSIYQTLRMSSAEEAKRLSHQLQWWVLANRGRA